MKIVLSMLMMLVSGTSLGAGGMTLYWSGRLDRCFHQQGQLNTLVDKQNVALKESSDALRNLTSATRHLIKATEPVH
jgi:hypothetical protein